MTATFIDTNKIAHTKLPGGQGDVAEIMNRDLCGAHNGVAMLRWLKSGERFVPEPRRDTHQLIYLMDGRGVITLANTDYPVSRGAGIYLGPSETATIRPAEDASVKLLHLVVHHAEDAPTR